MSRSRRHGGDLFNHAHGRALACGMDAEQMSRRLRLLSEEAQRTRMNRAAVLIEIAAQIVELEGRALEEDSATRRPGAG